MQVWYAFSGNGSQWPKMGLTLLHQSSIFRQSMLECVETLLPFGVDLIAEFESEEGFRTPLLASVGLLAIQMGLVDMLMEEYAISPHGCIGHSAGKVSSAMCIWYQRSAAVPMCRAKMRPHGVCNLLV